MPSQFTIYRSTDTSAPALTGTAGSLIALLDACLVNGYGSQSAAGWTHAFTTTSNVAVYQPGTGTGRLLRVQDDASLTGGARDTIIRGYETMSSLSVGTNPYPTTVQQANGINWRKSSTADSTARTWVVIADSRTVYILVSNTGDTSLGAGVYGMYMFGDFYSYLGSDAFNSMIIGCIGTSASAENYTSTGFYQGDIINAIMDSTLTGHYLDRNSAGGGSSTLNSKKGQSNLVGTSTGITTSALLGVLAFPNTSDGGLYLHPIWVMDSVSPDVIHGEMRGFYHQGHAVTNFGDQDTFSGAGSFSGRTFLMFKSTPSGGVYVFETSNTVNTN